jgi:1,3-beta-glucan synthase
LFILFLVLIIGPVIVRQFISINLSIPLELLQPTGQNNNDTSASATGSSLIGGGAAASAGGGGGGGGSVATTAVAAASSGINFGSLGPPRFVRF